MHVTTDVPTMKRALAVIKPGVARRSGSLPALTGARFEAKDGKVTVVGSDLDLTIQTEVSGEIVEEGIAIVPFTQLTKLVKGKGPLELRTTDNEHIAIQNGSLSTLRTLSAEEYILPPQGSTGAGIALDLDALAAVLPAAAKDDNRPILNGVLFRGNEIVSTDSYRLHRVIVDGAQYPEVLVPASALVPIVKHGQPAFLHADRTNTVKRWANNGKPQYLPRAGSYGTSGYRAPVKNPEYSAWQEDVEVVEDASFTSGSTTWTARLIEGEYPNYAQLIPDSFPFSFTFERAAMIEAIGSVKHLATAKQPVRLVLTRGSSTMTATVTSQDVGEARAEVTTSEPWLTSLNVVESDTTAVAFNPDFLLDALKVGVGVNATMSFTDSLKPAMLTEVDGPRTLDRLLMPVRVS